MANESLFVILLELLQQSRVLLVMVEEIGVKWKSLALVAQYAGSKDTNQAW